MKGRTKLSINQATMREAIEYWLNETIFKTAIVVEKVTGQVVNDRTGEFHIDILEPEHTEGAEA